MASCEASSSACRCGSSCIWYVSSRSFSSRPAAAAIVCEDGASFGGWRSTTSTHTVAASVRGGVSRPAPSASACAATAAATFAHWPRSLSSSQSSATNFSSVGDSEGSGSLALESTSSLPAVSPSPSTRCAVDASRSGRERRMPILHIARSSAARARSRSLQPCRSLSLRRHAWYIREASLTTKEGKPPSRRDISAYHFWMRVGDFFAACRAGAGRYGMTMPQRQVALPSSGSRSKSLFAPQSEHGGREGAAARAGGIARLRRRALGKRALGKRRRRT
mmetsp:Transcript_14263/g.42720  ORF Transcript_14263/g.42720 Transcript_14263/m.42720 type:complete len:278 (-) Transcript_14263:46-879(-)